MLTPRFIPSAQIILHNSDIATKLHTKYQKDGYKQTIISLYKAMAHSSPLEGYKIKLRNKRKFIAKGFKSKLISEYESPLYKGYIYEIKNRQGEAIMLKESDFFSPGILAIKLEKLYIEQGEKIKLFIIRG